MTFQRAAYTLIILILTCLIGFVGDLALFMTGNTTISEVVWDANRYSLFPVLLLGILAGHLATTPRG